MSVPWKLDAASGLWVQGPGTAAGLRAEAGIGLAERVRRSWPREPFQRPEEALLYRSTREQGSPTRLVPWVVGPIALIVAFVMIREPSNVGVWASAAAGILAVLYGLFAARRAARTAPTLWSQCLHGAVVASIITALLVFFLVVDQPRPHAHGITFLLYFLLIGMMGMAADPRVGVASGLASMLGYLNACAIVHASAAAGVPTAGALVSEFDAAAVSARFAILAGVTTTAAASSRRGLVVRRLSLRDPLTGLLNRRAFDSCLAMQASEASEPARQLSVAMIDIDHFKRLNDGFGHGAGDAVLVWIGSLLRRSVRDTDLVARYGGEEFVVAFLDSTDERLDRRMEEWRRQVEESALRLPGVDSESRITVSIGIARFPTEARDLHEVLCRAEERLYDAKRAGRNRVVPGEMVAS